MNEQPGNSYDEMPYINLPFAPTTPWRLAAQAQLFGLHPPPVETCRVLELGCASGDSLIPMALVLPQARFLGIDLSGRQVARGQETIARLGLANIELRHADIAGVDAAYGKYDYIASHGIYSWVPDAIRKKVLAICRDNLAANGVAYVSYNTLPGWSTHSILREAMTYHSRQAQRALEKVRQALTMLDFLGTSLRDDTAYAAQLREVIGRISREPDGYLLHDHMEDVNQPVYFHQFIDAAQRHGLQYLGEAEFNTMAQAGLTREFAEAVRRIAPDLISFEQCLDILANRSFRKTLLVHREAAPDHRLGAASVQRFMIASPVKPVSGSLAFAQGLPETFRAPSGAELSTVHALTKAALSLLIEQWPQGIQFDNLVAAARTRLSAREGAPAASPTIVDDSNLLGGELLQGLAAGVVDLRVWSPPIVRVAPERPVASPLARLQATQGDTVTNVLHQHVTLDALTRALLPLLDGTRERAALLAALYDLEAQGLLRPPSTALRPGRAAIEQMLQAGLDERLPQLLKAALLMS